MAMVVTGAAAFPYKKNSSSKVMSAPPILKTLLNRTWLPMDMRMSIMVSSAYKCDHHLV